MTADVAALAAAGSIIGARVAPVPGRFRGWIRGPGEVTAARLTATGAWVIDVRWPGNRGIASHQASDLELVPGGNSPAGVPTWAPDLGADAPRALIAWCIRDARTPEEAAERLARILNVTPATVRVAEVRALAQLRYLKLIPTPAPGELTAIAEHAERQFLTAGPA